jgi:hypothetical protein
VDQGTESQVMQGHQDHRISLNTYINLSIPQINRSQAPRQMSIQFAL